MNQPNGVKDRGVTFPFALTSEIFGNVAGGTSRRTIWENLIKAGVEIDFEKAAGWKGLSMSVNALYPQGSGLTSAAVHDFNTLSNIDGYDSLRLYEAWLQQEWGDGKFSIRAGQILADAEFFSSDYGALLINSSFGAIPIVSKNLNPPIFPVAAPGLRVRAAPGPAFYAEAAVFSGNVGDPSTTNKHNTRLSFRKEDGALVFGEIGYKRNSKVKTPASPATPDDGPSDTALSPALSGTFKLGGYYDTGKFRDNGGDSAHRGDYSIYFIIDQELWHPGGNGRRTLSCFSRFGAAPNDRNTVPFYAEAGFNLKGAMARREEDVLGLGMSYTHLSSDLVDDSGRRLESPHETIIELTYRAAFGDHVSVQPDLQIIFNPGAVQPAGVAVVTGLRLNVKF